jgi:hypothetical protein
MSSRPGAASSDSDADDDAFVNFVREHVSNAMRARRASASDDDDDARARSRLADARSVGARSTCDDDGSRDGDDARAGRRGAARRRRTERNQRRTRAGERE